MLCISFQPLTGWPPHPVWWFDSHLLVKYLNDIANLPTKWDSFSVYLGLCFFEKSASCLTPGQVLGHVYSIIKQSSKILYMSIFPLGCLKKVEM